MVELHQESDYDKCEKGLKNTVIHYICLKVIYSNYMYLLYHCKCLNWTIVKHC